MPQDLQKFSLPDNFRGKNVVVVQLWWAVQKSVFRHSPQFAYAFRRWILRLFGAKVGKDVLIRPTASFTYPWKISIGDYSWIGDNATLYSLGEIWVGENTVISQNSYLCAGDHDYRSESFEIRARNIFVGNQAWIASDVYIAPGVTVSDGCVIGARSSVFSDTPPGMICFGSPCRPIKPRYKDDSLQPRHGSHNQDSN